MKANLTPNPTVRQNRLATAAGVGGFACAAIRSYGKAVAATAATVNDGTTNRWAFVVARFHTDGTVDKPFDTGGKAMAFFNLVPVRFPTAPGTGETRNAVPGDGSVRQ